MRIFLRARMVVKENKENLGAASCGSFESFHFSSLRLCGCSVFPPPQRRRNAECGGYLRGAPVFDFHCETKPVLDRNLERNYCPAMKLDRLQKNAVPNFCQVDLADPQRD